MGHLRSTPLPVSATKLRSAEILANPDGVIRTRERDLVDNITMAMADTETPRNPDTGRRELRSESYGARAMKRGLWSESCAARAVQRELWSESYGARAVKRELRSESYGARAMERELWSESCEARAMEREL